MKKLLCRSGIYKIINLVNNKVYIGSTINLTERKWKHFSELKKKIHINKYLQRAVDKYGIDNFKFIVLLYCKPEHLVEYEQIIMDKYKAHNKEFGYNLLKRAYSSLGFKHSKETLIKLKQIRQEEAKTKIPWNKGKEMSLDLKQHLSNIRKGRPALNKGKPSKFKGTKRSEEICKKISEGKIKAFSIKKRVCGITLV